MKKILSFLTGNVLKEIGKVIDNIFTNDEERQLAKNQLVQIIQQKELELTIKLPTPTQLSFLK